MFENLQVFESMQVCTALRDQHKRMTAMLHSGKGYNASAFRAAQQRFHGHATDAPHTLAAWAHYENGPRGNMMEEIAGIRGANGSDLAMNRKRLAKACVQHIAVLREAYPDVPFDKVSLYNAIALEPDGSTRAAHTDMVIAIDEAYEFLHL